MAQQNDFKTALVTGASGGIGACIVRECASRGMNVVAVGRSRQRLVTITKPEPGHLPNRRIIPVVLDLLDDGAPRRLVDAVTAEDLAVDLLVNCAGQGLLSSSSVAPLATQLDVLRLNFEVPVALTGALLSTLLQRRGTVLNIASVAAYLPAPHLATLAASKAALLSWSVAMRRELMGRVAVTAFCRGVTRTAFLHRAAMDHLGLERTWLAAEPSLVARRAMAAVDRNDAVAFTSVLDRMVAGSTGLMPARATAWLASKVLRLSTAGVEEAR